MKVRFVEQASGVVLWTEERPSLFQGRFRSHPYVQLNSKRRATWWISRLDDSDPGLVVAYVEPSNERALRRASRRRSSSSRTQ